MSDDSSKPKQKVMTRSTRRKQALGTKHVAHELTPKASFAAEPTAPPVPSASSRARKLPEVITWSPWITAILVISSFLVGTVIAQLLVSIYPALKHMSGQMAQDWLSSSTGAQFAYTVLAYGLLLLPLWWFVRFNKVPLSTFGIKRPRWRDPGYALSVIVPYYICYFVIVSVVSRLIPSLNVDQQQQIGFSGAHGVVPLVLTFLSLAVIPPLVEETVVRGFLYTSFRAKLALPAAVILTSIIFAAGHLQFGSGAPLLWIAGIDTFTLSLFLIYLRQKTGSLWASIMLHALKNSVAFYYLFILHRG